MTSHFVLGVDSGTTGTTALLLDADERVHGRGYREHPQSFPSPGLVEHDPEALWRAFLEAIGDALKGAPTAPVAAIGLTNQRETVVLWDRATGKPVAPAIVWQDRRTAVACEALRRDGLEPRLQELTGLVIDPYFSATKIAWLLEHVPGLRTRAERGEIAFGTVDCWLLARLSGGAVHATDVSNAARTQLFDIRTLGWSDELGARFGVPRAVLPELRDNATELARTVGVPGLPDGTPVTGAAGDQQAALFGQGCVRPGDAKCTFGTGSFLLLNVGDQPVVSRHRLLGTVAWRMKGATTYALEGGAFVSGALVQWLRDGLGFIRQSAEVEALARTVPDAGGVVIVPALSGLGAPHWRADARGLLTGITRGTTRAHIARAALEAMALQNVEILRAMEADAGRAITSLRVDGGAAANDLLMQMQADLLGVEIVRPEMVESTALGAARLAAIGAGLRAPNAAAAADQGARRFLPTMDAASRDAALARYRDAVARA